MLKPTTLQAMVPYRFAVAESSKSLAILQVWTFGVLGRLVLPVDISMMMMTKECTIQISCLSETSLSCVTCFSDDNWMSVCCVCGFFFVLFGCWQIYVIVKIYIGQSSIGTGVPSAIGLGMKKLEDLEWRISWMWVPLLR